MLHCHCHTRESEEMRISCFFMPLIEPSKGSFFYELNLSMTVREKSIPTQLFPPPISITEFVGLSNSSEDYTLSSLPEDKRDFTSINITNI